MKIGCLLTLTLVGFAAGIGISAGQQSPLPAQLLNPLQADLARAEFQTPEISQSIVLDIKDSADLVVAKYRGQETITTSAERKLIGGVIGETQLIYEVVGEVHYGVDLSKLNASNFQTAGWSVTVQMPSAEITHASADVELSDTLDYDRGLLGPDVAPKLQQQALKVGLKRIKAAAAESTARDQANQNLRQLVEKLLLNAGFTEVQVEIAD